MARTLYALPLFMLLLTVMLLSSCASSGPSRERLTVLLHECRIANRERARLLKTCHGVGEQNFGTIDHGEASY